MILLTLLFVWIQLIIDVVILLSMLHTMTWAFIQLVPTKTANFIKIHGPSSAIIVIPASKHHEFLMVFFYVSFLLKCFYIHFSLIVFPGLVLHNTWKLSGEWWQSSMLFYFFSWWDSSSNKFVPIMKVSFHIVLLVST